MVGTGAYDGYIRIWKMADGSAQVRQLVIGSQLSKMMMYVCACVRACMRACACLCTYACMCVYACMHACMLICKYVCLMCIFMCVCMCACLGLRVNTCSIMTL